MCQKIDKQEKMAEVYFNQLSTRIHEIDEVHETFVTRNIANSLYDMAPKHYSGLISKEAKELLTTNQIKRKDLCKEHPYPRMRTAKDLLSTFNAMGNSNPEAVKAEFSKIIERGCKVHIVTTKENQKLYPHQQDYTLSEDEIYARAGVELVPDDIKGVVYRFELYGKKYETIDSIARYHNVSKYRVEKLIKSGEIKRL